ANVSLGFRAREVLFSKLELGPTTKFGEKHRAIPVSGSVSYQLMPVNPLLRVCALLNEEGARYLVCGGQAVILHGIIRTTEDVDILIEPSEENCRRVIAALSHLQDGAAKELSPRDLLENVVVKIAD